MPIPVRMFQISFVEEVALSAAQRSLILLYIVSRTTDFRFCFRVELCVFFPDVFHVDSWWWYYGIEQRVRLGVRLRQL